MLLVTDLPHNQGRQFDIAELQPSSEIHPQFTGFLTVATTKIYLFPDASKKKVTDIKVPATLYSP